MTSRHGRFIVTDVAVATPSADRPFAGQHVALLGKLRLLSKRDVRSLIERLGGGDAMAIVSSMNVGAHLVDVSPLSTTGALCLAAAPFGSDNRALFNKLLAWGLSMTIVGSLICWVFFGLLGL